VNVLHLVFIQLPFYRVVLVAYGEVEILLRGCKISLPD